MIDFNQLAKPASLDIFSIEGIPVFSTTVLPDMEHFHSTFRI